MPKKTKEEKIFLTNHEVQSIFNWCYVMLLHGDKARIRNKVMNYFTPLTAAYQADRTQILEKYCKKDADQKPIVENGKYDFTEENEPKVREEMEALITSEIPFTLDKDRLPILKGVVTLLKESLKEPLDVNMGRTYDDIMGKLENI